MRSYQKKLTLMDALIQKHYLLSRGFTYAGDSATVKDSPHYDGSLMQKLLTAEKVEMIPTFQPIKPGQYFFLGGKEMMLEGIYSFYAVMPEEVEEKIPDTWPGGFRVQPKTNQPEKSVSPYKTIRRKLPSELLKELNTLKILYENVHKFYFEPNENKGNDKKYKHILTIDDLVIMSRMENKKTLDTVKLQQSNQEDQKLGRRLEHTLRLSPLITKASRGQVYTLSSEALDGMYTAIVHKRYLR